MLRFSSGSVSLLGLSCFLLVGCDVGSSSNGPSAGAANSGGSTASGAGAGGAAAGASATNGGSVGQAGSTPTAGASGAATGSAGAPPSGGAPATAGAGGSGGSAPNGNCTGALLCEDFEAYTGTPGAPWKVTKNSAGNVIIDTAQHRSGTKAVKFTTSGASDYQQAYMSVDKMFPVANNAFYGRMMIYTTKAPNDGVHWTMIQGEGAATAQGITSAMVRYGGQHMQGLMANYDSKGKASDCYQHSATKMPEGKWACMEWYFDGASNTQKFWLDGKAIADLTVVGEGEGCVSHDTQDKWIYPTFARVDLGWESYQKDDAREVWIDDVAIGTTQIGCPQ